MTTRVRRLDIVTLRLIVERNRAGDPPSRANLYSPNRVSDINDYMDRIGIRPYLVDITGNNQLAAILKRLRDANLLLPEGRYIPTHEGELFADELEDDWKLWPIAILFDDEGTPDWDNAVFEDRDPPRNYRVGYEPKL